MSRPPLRQIPLIPQLVLAVKSVRLPSFHWASEQLLETAEPRLVLSCHWWTHLSYRQSSEHTAKLGPKCVYWACRLLLQQINVFLFLAESTVKMIQSSTLTADITSPLGADRDAESAARGNRSDNPSCGLKKRWIIKVRRMIRQFHVHPPTAVLWKLMKICPQVSKPLSRWCSGSIKYIQEIFQNIKLDFVC